MNNSTKGNVKETIIRESTKLFLANGFRGTSVKEITEAAGIGRGTLYWYFKSKDEILECIFREWERKYVDGLIETVGRCEGNFVKKYKAFHKYATEYARDDRELALASNTLLNEIVGSNTEAEKVVKEIYEKYRRFVEGMLEDGKRDGSVRAEANPTVYAHVVMAIHSGMLVQWFVGGETLDVRTFVRTFRDFFLDGITSRKGQ